MARAVFTHPEWEAEGDQGSNSPSALGIEEMCGSMAGIPEPPQSKETPEWWVKMWVRTEQAQPFCWEHSDGFFCFRRHCNVSAHQVMRCSLGCVLWQAWLPQLICWTVRKILFSMAFKRKCFTIPLMKTCMLSIVFWLRDLWEGCIQDLDQSFCGFPW